MRLAFACLVACCFFLLVSCSDSKKQEASAKCGAGETQCKKLCVDTEVDPAHCGGCDQACADGEACVRGACAVNCEGELRACAGRCVDWQRDSEHCGGCEQACAEGETCAEGECRPGAEPETCSADLARCAGECVDTSTDDENCGDCGIACVAGTQCSAGKCVCPASLEDCEGACVDTQTSDSHCGECGASCDPGFECRVGGCVCPEGSEACGGICVDTKTNPEHCGACGVACGDLDSTRGPFVCSGGACVLTCEPGHASCDEDWHNGCETDLTRSVEHCGECDKGCSAPGATEVACIASTCEILKCEEGLGNCDFDVATGCETSVSNEVTNCGECGQSCLALPNVEQPFCDAGECAFDCKEGWEDCDEDPSTGCEAHPEDDPLNCGVCGTKCDQFCANGACVEIVAADPGETFTCAAIKDGPVYCWGRNTYGQLGNGDTKDSHEPVEVQGLHGVLDVKAGDNFACALDQQGQVWCWGWGAGGRLGSGDTTSRSTPVLLVVPKAVQLGAGLNHACALLEAGTVYCWGNNARAQVGGGDGNPEVKTPRVVAGLSGVSSLSVGREFNCALKEGEVWCWGFASWGQAGNNNTDTRKSPTRVTMFTNASAVATGGNHSCVVEGGEVWCAGNSSHGQVGNGAAGVDRIRAHEKVPGLKDVVGLALGHQHSCARTAAGELFCWGRNNEGQLGDGSVADVLVPKAVGPALTQFVSSLFHTTCALSIESGLWCWGRNDYGQLGIPVPPLDKFSTVPVNVGW